MPIPISNLIIHHPFDSSRREKLSLLHNSYTIHLYTENQLKSRRVVFGSRTGSCFGFGFPTSRTGQGCARHALLTASTEASEEQVKLTSICSIHHQTRLHFDLTSLPLSLQSKPSQVTAVTKTDTTQGPNHLRVANSSNHDLNAASTAAHPHTTHTAAWSQIRRLRTLLAAQVLARR